MILACCAGAVLGLVMLSIAGSAVASEEQRLTPSLANPNNITYRESLTCLSRVLRPTNVPSIQASLPLVRRGASGTRGPIIVASRLRLDNLCVINSPSIASRLHPAGQRAIASTIRIKRRGAPKYGDWVLIGPSAVGPAIGDVPPHGAVHQVNITASPDGLASTGRIRSLIRLPAAVARLRPGDRVQSGVIIDYQGLILYDTGRVDPLSPEQRVTIQVGAARVIPGPSVKVKKQARRR